MGRIKRRRGQGEGSIFQRKDGRWVAQVVLGYSPEGRRIVKLKYGRTRAEVAAWLAQTLADRQRGLVLEKPSDVTLAQFLDRWLEDVVRHTCRPLTYASYRGLVRTHIAPALGGVRLQKLTPARIQAFYGEKLAQGLSPRTVQYLHAVLHRALEQALKWGLLARNPADAVERPRVARRKMAVWTEEQARAFLRAARDDRFYALYVLALTTGMRQGELLGLTWDGVDLEAGRLQVRHQLVCPRDGSPPFLAEPKTATGRRPVDIPPSAVAALKQHRRRQAEDMLRLGEAWGNRWNLVFTTEAGTPVHPSNLLHRSFYPLLRRAGVPRIRFHDLRHTVATTMLSRGVHPKVVQELLGHSSVTITLDTYSHVLPTLRRQAAQLMEDLLRPARATDSGGS